MKKTLTMLTLGIALTAGGLLAWQKLPAVAHAQGAADMASADELFAPIATVSQHPRCLNCHTVTEWPRQGDSRHRHSLNVVRGPDNHGIPGVECSACHQEANNDVGGIPGAPHWGLAPLSMAWEYMTPAQMCEQLKDPARNGGKTVAELHKHMVEDPLVLWAWKPGLHPDGTARTLPPIDLANWEVAMERWVEAGAPCPEGDGR